MTLSETLTKYWIILKENLFPKYMNLEGINLAFKFKRYQILEDVNGIIIEVLDWKGDAFELDKRFLGEDFNDSSKIKVHPIRGTFTIYLSLGEVHRHKKRITRKEFNQMEKYNSQTCPVCVGMKTIPEEYYDKIEKGLITRIPLVLLIDPDLPRKECFLCKGKGTRLFNHYLDTIAKYEQYKLI